MDKKNAPKNINNNEYKLNDESFILSKTDKYGKIIYCNDSFIEASGYEREELINSNHNLLRHPDMPKVAFEIAWEFIKQKDDFYGFIKNLRKDGGYYWVFAYISPDYNDRQDIIGYTSIRRKIREDVIPSISSLYKELISQEKNRGVRASRKYLEDIMKDMNMEYNEFIIMKQIGELK